MSVKAKRNDVVTTTPEGALEQLSQVVVADQEKQLATVAADVAPLNHSKALAALTPEEQKEIMTLADSIDPLAIEKVMHYGDAPLKATFEQCGAFLKDERGSQADQMVIAQVIELSKKAAESYEEFNLVLQEPNFFQKLLLKIFSGGKKRSDKVKNSAVTNYQLLMELKKSGESWLEMLRDAMEEIYASAMGDLEAVELLEKYLIAGKIAEERIQQELEVKRLTYEETGSQKDAYQYDEYKEGANLFAIRLSNLEKSRVMYHLSLAQLGLVKRSNRNVQISIHTQMENSMTLMAQQLRVAVLNAKNQEVLEGQKAITRLNDELMKEVSTAVGLTAKETEQLIYSGFYTVEAAKTAVKTVIDTCSTIEQTATEMLPKMKAETEELNKLISELEPHVKAIPMTENGSTNKNTKSTTKKGKGKLTF